MDVSNEAVEAADRAMEDHRAVDSFGFRTDPHAILRIALEAGGRFLIAEALEREADEWSVEVAKLDASPDDYDRWAANDVKEVVDGLRAQAASYRAGEA